MPDINETIEALGRAFEEFKATNDERLKQIETKGHADPLLQEKLDKTNAKIGELEAEKARLDDLERRMNSADLGAVSGDGQSTAQKEHSEAFNRYMRKGADSGLYDMQQKAMTVAIDPDGGYVTPSQMSNRIVQTVFETSPMRQICTVETISAESYEILVDNDEAGAGWVGETDSRDDTDTPQLGKIVITPGELYAQPKASQKLLDDASVDIEAWLSRKVADKFARTENAAFLTGNGVGKPRGLLTHTPVANANYAWGSPGYIASGKSAAWADSNPSDALISTVYALKAAYRTGASWLMSKSRVGEVRAFKEATTNAYIWQPGLAAGQPSTLLQYPVIEAEDMPALAADSLSVAFGNFREAYTIVDRIGIRVLRDPFTAKPYVRFYTTKRVGGDVTNYEAFKVIKFASS